MFKESKYYFIFEYKDPCFAIQYEIANFLKTKSYLKFLNINGTIMLPELIKALAQTNIEEIEENDTYFILNSFIKIILNNKSIQTLNLIYSSFTNY